MWRLISFLSMAIALSAQQPPKTMPSKTDLVYLQQADDLIATEAAEAQQSQKNGETTYWVAGEHTTAKTPLGSPIFIVKQDKLPLESLGVYAFEIKNGRRELTFSKKKQTQGFSLTITTLHDDIHRMEVNETLEPGEYAVVESGTKQVFCFAVF